MSEVLEWGISPTKIELLEDEKFQVLANKVFIITFKSLDDRFAFSNRVVFFLFFLVLADMHS